VADIGSLLEQADYAVVDPKCAREAQSQIEASSFVLGAKRARVKSQSRVKWLLYFRE